MIDIASLVKEGLEIMGCDRSLVGDIDSHSTIALDFRDRPSILIVCKGEQIWFWSSLSEYPGEAHYGLIAPQLLEELMKGYAYIEGEHLSVMKNNDELQVRALISPDYLGDPAKFAEALSEFFESIHTLQEIVNK